MIALVFAKTLVCCVIQIHAIEILKKYPDKSMAGIILKRITTPGAFNPRVVFIVCILLMLLIYFIDLNTGTKVLFSVLYIFPLAVIALQSNRLSESIVGVVVSSALQFATFLTFHVSGVSLTIDSVVAVAASTLTIFLARSLRMNQLEILVLANQDALTGLSNRRNFETQIDLEISRQLRYGGFFSLAIIDLDNFKQVNDLQGHQAGDEVLRIFAEILRDCTRQADTIVRLGGDEFAILMPNTRKIESNLLCQKLNEEIRCKMSSAGFAITSSIGIATFEHAPESRSKALQMADKAMYEAKNQGKGRVVCSEPHLLLSL